MASTSQPVLTTMGVNEIVTNVDHSVQYSNRLLSQGEGLGVYFYTINFARYACANIQLSPDGQRLYNHCLLNIPRWACSDERLQFGFGDKHLLRNAGVQLYEYEHLLLASALGEFFSEDYAAAIFNALADYFEDDNRPKPRLSSFKAFVRCTNGLLSFTHFPTTVDDRVRLNPYRDHDGGVPHADRTTEFVPIDKVALAIHMLSQCKHGKYESLTFIGGDIIGWLSAFVEVFLGMNQTLADKDGNTLYWSNGQSQSIKLIYVPPETPPESGNATEVWLRKPINTSKRSDAIPPIFTGRVVGEAMFSKVFGTAFHRLDQTEAKAFGNAFGGLARYWELRAGDEDAQEWMSSAMRSDPSAWGRGLIQTWADWFPELRHLQGRMERAQKLDKTAAGKMCEESITHLEPRCGCYICSKTQGPEDNPTNVPKFDFCIPTMMETIIILGLTLNHVTLVPDLFPSRAGILAMYKVQVKRRLQIKSLEGRDKDRFQILFGEEFKATTTRRLRNVATLFSGSRPTTDLADNLLAISHEGMCAYVMKLQRGDQSPPREDDDVIRVVPGPINWRQKTYSRLCVGPVQPPVELSEGWEAFSCEHFKDKIYVK